METISIKLVQPARATAEQFSAGAAAAWLRFARWAQTTWCVINGGHYKLLHAAPDRLALRCVACGHSSPGWSIDRARLVPVAPRGRRRG